MKKLITIAAMAMLVGATVSQAQIIVTTTVNQVTVLAGPLNIDVKVKVSDSKTAPTVTGLKWALVRDEIGSSSGNVFSAIGTAITETDNAEIDPTNVTSTVGLSTNVVLVGDDVVDLGKGKFAEALFQLNSDTAQPFGMSNSAWFVQGSVTRAKGTNFTAKVQGIWMEGSSAFSGSVKTSKVQ
jgi:hypothetical protein